MSKDLIPQLYKDLQKEKTKIAGKAFNVLNSEGIAGIIEKDGVFWFEFYNRGNSCPVSVYSFLVRYIKKKYGFRYLHDHN